MPNFCRKPWRRNNGESGTKIPCYAKTIPCYRKSNALLFKQRFRAPRCAKALQNRRFSIATRADWAPNRCHSLYFSLLQANDGEKFERFACPSTNSDPHVRTEVEVAALEMETEGGVPGIFADPAICTRKRRPDTRRTVREIRCLGVGFGGMQLVGLRVVLRDRFELATFTRRMPLKYRVEIFALEVEQ